MKVTMTAKLKLHTTPEQFQALRRMQLASRAALNYVWGYAFAHGKMSNKVKLHTGTYRVIRARFGIGAQMACSIPRQVGATYKGLWTKARKNAQARAAGQTKKRYKGLDAAPKFVSPTLEYQLGHAYSFKTERRVSVLTLHGRVVVPSTGYDKHVALLEAGARIGTAKLWYDQSKKRFYLLVSLEVEVAEPTAESHQHLVGVDVGQRYLAVTATLDHGASFHAGNEVRAKADHLARTRKRLQRQGTRTATRRLIGIARRERRLMQDRNHVLSHRIVAAHPHRLIGLEELTGIRDRTKRKHGKKASQKQRRANRHASAWAFAELHALLAYKALLAGNRAIKVDADYTSQACPKCGYTSRANRPQKGLLFVCRNCHYTLHADLIGARNIALRTLLARQNWTSTGVLSVRPGSLDPDTSARFAKVARLQRDAELRWSPDASPRL